MIGTGGVGSGSFFALDGNQTLGREESRGGRFLDCQDYCKLHIISHYVKVLSNPEFTVTLASKIGDDPAGHRLLADMDEIGLDRRYVAVSPGDATLYSICFLYPDGSGGNLTTSNAATARVDTSFIENLAPEFARWHGQGVALAVPEVPLPARQRLFELAKAHEFFTVASLTREEAKMSASLPILQNCDLLALNLEEAAALGQVELASRSAPNVIQAVLERLQGIQPGICLSVTAGRQGSWCWDGAALTHTPSISVEVVNTAGAGDAHLAGVIVARAAGLSLPVAHQLGALVAAMKVTGEHTIHKGISPGSLLEFALQAHVAPSSDIVQLLQPNKPLSSGDR